MNVALSLKTIAVLTFVAISTASIVQLPAAAHPAQAACAVAAISALAII